MSGSVALRAMREHDVAAVAALGNRTFDDKDARLDTAPATPWDDPARFAASVRRVAAAVASDPDGGWVAEDGEGMLGAAIALRRGGLWVLSLLVVRPGSQGLGTGARLLAAARRTEPGSSGGLIFASRDPRALRRYQRAGYALLPSYQAAGAVDRALLPGELGVRDGDPGRDGELCDAVGTALRGVGHGGDLDALVANGHRLLVADDRRGQGFVMVGPAFLGLCGATDVETARRLLWAALAESPPEARVMWVTGAQQWAIDVLLDARLSLRSGGSVCVRGDVGPFSPYLPSGVYG